MRKYKFLLLLMVILLSGRLASAQTRGDRVGYTVNEFALGTGFYNDGYHYRPIYMASYLLGRHFNERWFGGISAVCTYNSYYAGYMYYGERVYEETFALRILLNGRYHICKGRFTPYVGIDLGPAYIPGYAKKMQPYGGCQLGLRWLLKTHSMIGFTIEPGVCTNGYKEVLFKLTYEFI
jgi:hypothetical protein